MTRVDGKSPARAAEQRARAVQSRAEHAQTGDTFTWKDETFRLEPGEIPGVVQLMLVQMGAADMTSLDPASEDTARQILELCLAQPHGPQPGDDGWDPAEWDPGDYRKFMRHAARTRASIGEIMDALKTVVEIFAARPTQPPPGSSNGRPVTTANSTGSSSPPVGGGSGS